MYLVNKLFRNDMHMYPYLNLPLSELYETISCLRSLGHNGELRISLPEVNSLRPAWDENI